MEIIKKSLKDHIIIKPKVFEDERGYFIKSFKDTILKENFPSINFIHDHKPKPYDGVVRGFIFKNHPSNNPNW